MDTINKHIRHDINFMYHHIISLLSLCFVNHLVLHKKLLLHHSDQSHYEGCKMNSNTQILKFLPCNQRMKEKQFKPEQ